MTATNPSSSRKHHADIDMPDGFYFYVPEGLVAPTPVITAPPMTTVKAAASPKPHPNSHKQISSKVLSRQTFTNYYKRTKQKPRRRTNYKFAATMMSVVIVMSLILSSLAYLKWPFKVKTHDVLPAQTSIPNNQNVRVKGNNQLVVSETSLTDRPSIPTSLKIPKFGIEAKVDVIDALSNNDLVPPSDINHAGWYHGSGRPLAPDKGLVVLDGIMAGDNGPGLFYSLGDIQSGDEIQIVRGDSQLASYRVVLVKKFTVDHINLNEVMTPIDSTKAGVNLVSVGSRFDYITNRYLDRFIIYAVQN